MARVLQGLRALHATTLRTTQVVRVAARALSSTRCLAAKQGRGPQPMFTVKDLFDNRVHLGHVRGASNPAMAPYLHTEQHGLTIFNLDMTAQYLQRALDMTRSVVANQGTVLFVGGNEKFEETVRRTAVSCGEYYVSRKWMGGCLTNTYHVLGANQHPDLVIFLTLPYSHSALKEVKLCHIPTIGIVDTTESMDLVEYPIPANDDSMQSVSYLAGLFAKAVLAGKEDVAKNAALEPRLTVSEFKEQKEARAERLRRQRESRT
eukprot:m.361345 g.361345  ORF g.361345 m.361345 type:complete len:262 (-) comp19491_c0_seq1:104-889(-)